MSSNADTITIEEIEKVEETLAVVESVTKLLTLEEMNTYSTLTDHFLLTAQDLSFDSRLMALALLKTLSHLSGSKEKLYSQFENFPLEKHRALYYAVPFLSEIAGKGNLMEWHQKEMKTVFELKIQKGDYNPLRLMILLYESIIFQAVMDKKRRKSYFMLSERIFTKIRASIVDLQKAFGSKDKQHHWLSLDKSSIIAFKQVAYLWKNIIDATTVRHGTRLPSKFRRPPEKLPFEWRELLKIKTAKKISMINAIYPLKGLSSQCREIRTYSSFLLHQVCSERVGFLDSFKHTQLDKHFLSRLRVGYSLKAAYPKLPAELPDHFQLELFLVLIEQATNSLAQKHNLGGAQVTDVQTQFSDFNEQVQTKSEIVVELPKDNIDLENDSSSENEEAPKPTIETDFPDLTDDIELGMGMQTIPYIFPFQYQDNQEEIALEHIPSIRWDELKWHVMTAGGVSLKVAETQLFIDKLEKVHAYRYDIYSIKEVRSLKPYQQFNCFIGKVEEENQTRYYIVKKGEKNQRSGKSTVTIKIDLSEEYIKNIDRAYFFIFPGLNTQHIFVIPR